MGSGSPAPEADAGRPSRIRRILGALRHPFRRGPRLPETMAHHEPVSFETAERDAFRASTSAPTPEPSALLTVAARRATADRSPVIPADPIARTPASPPAGQSVAAKPEAIRATVARTEGTRDATPSSTEVIPSSIAPEVTSTPHRRQAGETAPESLLRAPAGAASIADDFFDALVRRVEGDR